MLRKAIFVFFFFFALKYDQCRKFLFVKRTSKFAPKKSFLFLKNEIIGGRDSDDRSEDRIQKRNNSDHKIISDSF